MVLFLRNKRFNVTLFFLITNWGGGDYQLRSAHTAKHVRVAVITNWGLLHTPSVETDHFGVMGAGRYLFYRNHPFWKMGVFFHIETTHFGKWAFSVLKKPTISQGEWVCFCNYRNHSLHQTPMVSPEPPPPPCKVPCMFNLYVTRRGGRQAAISDNIFPFHATQAFLSFGSHEPQPYGLSCHSIWVFRQFLLYIQCIKQQDLSWEVNNNQSSLSFHIY